MTTFPEPHQPNPSHRMQEANFIVVSHKGNFANENSHGCAVWRTACKWLHGTVFAHAALCRVFHAVFHDAVTCQPIRPALSFTASALRFSLRVAHSHSVLRM